jgi:hypothetical protein
MVVDEEYLYSILENVAKKLNLGKWSHVSKLTKNLINYTGNFLSVSLVEEGNSEEIGLIIKQVPRMQILRNALDRAYNTEVYVYLKLMPIFEMLKCDVNTEELWPQCYHADSNKEYRVLVLKDMTLQGFERHQGKYFDCDHMIVSLKAISRFHALSFVLFEKNIEVHDWNIVQPYIYSYPEDYSKLIQSSFSKSLRIFENTYYFKFLLDLNDNFEEILNNCASKTKRRVCGHGDFWKENILFKYFVSTNY